MRGDKCETSRAKRRGCKQNEMGSKADVCEIVSKIFDEEIAESYESLKKISCQYEKVVKVKNALVKKLVSEYYGRADGKACEAGSSTGMPPAAHPAVQKLCAKSPAPDSGSDRPRLRSSRRQQHESVHTTTRAEHSSLRSEAPAALRKCNERLSIIVGNTSMTLTTGKNSEPSPTGNCSYGWMLYVVTGSKQTKLERFIKKVEFQLSPEYKPNDVVEVCKPPFVVCNAGRGNFDVQVKLFFHDFVKQQPLLLRHELRLDRQGQPFDKVISESMFCLNLRTEQVVADGTTSQLLRTSPLTLREDKEFEIARTASQLEQLMAEASAFVVEEELLADMSTTRSPKCNLQPSPQSSVQYNSLADINNPQLILDSDSMHAIAQEITIPNPNLPITAEDLIPTVKLTDVQSLEALNSSYIETSNVDEHIDSIINTLMGSDVGAKAVGRAPGSEEKTLAIDSLTPNTVNMPAPLNVPATSNGPVIAQTSPNPLPLSLPSSPHLSPVRPLTSTSIKKAAIVSAMAKGKTGSEGNVVRAKAPSTTDQSRIILGRVNKIITSQTNASSSMPVGTQSLLKPQFNRRLAVARDTHKLNARSVANDHNYVADESTSSCSTQNGSNSHSVPNDISKELGKRRRFEERILSTHYASTQEAVKALLGQVALHDSNQLSETPEEEKRRMRAGYISELLSKHPSLKQLELAQKDRLWKAEEVLAFDKRLQQTLALRKPGGISLNGKYNPASTCRLVKLSAAKNPLFLSRPLKIIELPTSNGTGEAPPKRFKALVDPKPVLGNINTSTTLPTVKQIVESEK